MTDTRSNFHQQLERLEAEVLSMGAYAEQMLADAVAALVTSDAAAASAVIAMDDDLDNRYLEVERTWLETMALQMPVASDLRLMSVVLHTNHSLERIGDQAVSTAAAVEITEGFPTHQQMLTIIGEVGNRVRAMVRASLSAMQQRDLEGALALPSMGKAVTKLNRQLIGMVAECKDNERQLEWAVRMVVVARNLERVGARAIDIAEQVAFLLSGVFLELS
jgi:phosphate transport system protein